MIDHQRVRLLTKMVETTQHENHKLHADRVAMNDRIKTLELLLEERGSRRAVSDSIMCTTEKLVEMLHDASEAVSASDKRDLFKAAAIVIERQNDLLKPFAKEADEYNGWSGLVMVEADEEGGVREAWYSMADLRKARDEVRLWYRLPNAEAQS